MVRVARILGTAVFGPSISSTLQLSFHDSIDRSMFDSESFRGGTRGNAWQDFACTNSKSFRG